MKSHEYVICARCGGTPLRSMALNYPFGWRQDIETEEWLCFPCAQNYGSAETLGRLAAAGWLGREARDA